MEPLVVVIAGLIALTGGAVVLRSFGPGYRVGRLLAGTPTATIEQAEALAEAGSSGYVRLEGRLDSADDFPDEHERPLVFRRRRLEAYRSGRWSVIEEDRQAVPFEIRDGLAVVAIDGDALDEGLVVLPRESLGTAAEAPDRLPAGLPPSTPVRLRIEQVSSVEHATVVGVPRRRADGTTVLTAGLGRPLILSTLEQVEAMQLLAGGRRGRPLAAMALLVGGLLLLALGLAWGARPDACHRPRRGRRPGRLPRSERGPGWRHPERGGRAGPRRGATDRARGGRRHRDRERPRHPRLRPRDLGPLVGSAAPPLIGVAAYRRGYVRPIGKNCEVP